MVTWTRAVTDRTQSDVKHVIELMKKEWKDFSIEEKEEWNSGMKGAMNLSDLNRIQSNTRLLSDVLELNLIVEDVPVVPNVIFFKSVVKNTETIRNAYMIHSATPPTPAMPINSFRKVNDIEKILEDVYEILLNNFSYYCGTEIYAGEITGLLL